LTGVLIGRDHGEAVQYGTVLLVGTGEARFTDALGNFRITRLPPGAYTLRARQIGYAPVDTTVDVDPAPAVTTVTIRLARLPAVLGLVKVEGHRAKGCVATGIPDSTVNPRLAAIFTQVRENIDRFRLLLDAYPFRFSREERRLIRLEPGGDSAGSVDTVTYESRDRRPYRIGGIIFAESDSSTINLTRSCHYNSDAGANVCETTVSGKPTRNRQLMYLPTFRDLEDSTFLSAHCFAYGGTESVGGPNASQLIRVDFRPASAIRVPDVEGSIYLDAQRLIVRRAVFEMTKPDAVDPPLIGFKVTTTFIELVPLVPVVDSVKSEQPLPGRLAAGGLVGVGGEAMRRVNREAITNDRLLAVTFEGQSLGAGASAPPTAMLPASAPATPGPAPLLAGRIVQPDGTPVQGAMLSLMGTSDTLTTSDSGRFAIRDVPSGAYMLWVRHIGFRDARVPITISRQRPHEVTITLARAVPRLPTVTTTAQLRGGYHDVGLDQRMAAGVGQFVTYDQIVRRQATQVTQLLTGIRGILVGQQHMLGDGSQHVGGNNTVVPTRGGRTTCVQVSIDGVAQTQAGERDLDNLIQPSDVGAVEVYTGSERPPGFGGQGIMALPGCEDVVLIAIWTRTRLGIVPAGTAADSTTAADVIRGIPTFASGSACELAPTPDTIQVLLRATLQGLAPGSEADSAWSHYTARVLSAVRRSFALPTALTLPAVGFPFAGPTASDVGAHAKPASLEVAPTLSTVVAFVLDSAGSLRSARVAASSFSGAADTSVLAAVERAAALHDFPVLGRPQAGPGPNRFVLVVSTNPPAAVEQSVVLGRIDVPMWPLRRQASLATAGQPRQPVDSATHAGGADSLSFEFVVDEGGHVVRSTIRGNGRLFGSTVSEHPAAVATRIADQLGQTQFAPALIGACPVAQAIEQSFPVP